MRIYFLFSCVGITFFLSLFFASRTIKFIGRKDQIWTRARPKWKERMNEQKKKKRKENHKLWSISCPFVLSRDAGCRSGARARTHQLLAYRSNTKTHRIRTCNLWKHTTIKHNLCIYVDAENVNGTLCLLLDIFFMCGAIEVISQ